jgi:hypothetical protein
LCIYGYETPQPYQIGMRYTMPILRLSRFGIGAILTIESYFEISLKQPIPYF